MNHVSNLVTDNVKSLSQQEEQGGVLGSQQYCRYLEFYRSMHQKRQHLYIDERLIINCKVTWFMIHYPSDHQDLRSYTRNCTVKDMQIFSFKREIYYFMNFMEQAITFTILNIISFTSLVFLLSVIWKSYLYLLSYVDIFHCSYFYKFTKTKCPKSISLSISFLELIQA